MKKKEKYNIAIMGATGAVGSTFLNILTEKDLPIGELRLLASERSRGKKLKFKGEEIEVQVLNENSFEGIDIVLASAGASRSKEFLPHAVKAGAVCIDNSSAYRMEDEVPLVVPEVNPEDIETNKGIIANPNCSTIQMMLPLKAIQDKAGLKRIVVSTYQSVSGAGQPNIEELEKQVVDLAKKDQHHPVGMHNVDSSDVVNFQHQISYNLIPHIDVFLENGYTKEEMKMVNESRKILHMPDLQVTATCVRVPVYYAHSESVNIETVEKITREEVIDLMKECEGVKLVEDVANNAYPMPIDAEGQNATLVGRIREDESTPNGINMWVVADNLRKGAALNAVQIAEKLIG